MAITRDSGAAFPVTASLTGAGLTATTASFTVNSANPVMVAVVAYENFTGTNVTSCTVGWSGGTPTGASGWTKIAEAVPAAANGFASIWMATGPNSGVSGTVVATVGASDAAAAMVLMVDALTSSSTYGTAGANNSVVHTSSAQNSITVNGVATGSWVYVANYDENTADTPVSGTTEVLELSPGTGPRAAVGVNTSGTSGNTLVGWSSATGYNGLAAVEIQIQPVVSTVTLSEPTQGSAHGFPITLSGVASPPGAGVEVHNELTGEVLGTTVSDGATGAWSLNITHL